MNLYPNCGCPPEQPASCGIITNVICRNPECLDYGTHRRGVEGDRCNWCGVPYTPLARDPFKGAR